jgi:hypothetical protein
MAFTEPYCLVVANGVLQNSSDVFAILDPDAGGSGTFSVPLSANGQLPATDWAAYTPLLVDVYEALTTMDVQQFKTFVDQRALEFGRQPVGSVTAFKNNVRIGGQGDPLGFIASLGLQRILASA